MSLRKYLTSKVFIAQVLTALGIVAGLVFLFFHWITFITKHGEEIIVPNLSQLTEAQVEEKLSGLNLDYEILDTVDYRPNFPKLAVMHQEPIPGSKVKSGRKIYLKINALEYKKVTLPNLIDKTYRQAVPTLISLGLKPGQITYAPHIGRDMVLEMRVNGNKVKPGARIYKATKIDLVLGDGEVVFDESEIDSLMQIVPKAEVLEEDENGNLINKDTIK